jgi:hypothetical protein
MGFGLGLDLGLGFGLGLATAFLATAFGGVLGAAFEAGFLAGAFGAVLGADFAFEVFGLEILVTFLMGALSGLEGDGLVFANGFNARTGLPFLRTGLLAGLETVFFAGNFLAGDFGAGFFTAFEAFLAGDFLAIVCSEWGCSECEGDLGGASYSSPGYPASEIIVVFA